MGRGRRSQFFEGQNIPASKGEFDDYEWFGDDEKATPAPTKKAAPAPALPKKKNAKKAATPKKAPPAPVTTDKKKRPEGLPANVVYPNKPRREGLRERKK